MDRRGEGLRRSGAGGLAARASRWGCEGGREPLAGLGPGSCGGGWAEAGNEQVRLRRTRWRQAGGGPGALKSASLSEANKRSDGRQSQILGRQLLEEGAEDLKATGAAPTLPTAPGTF